MKKRVDFYNTSLWILFKKELLKVINEEENSNVLSLDKTYAKDITPKEVTAIFSDALVSHVHHTIIDAKPKTTIYPIYMNNKFIFGVVIFPSSKINFIINEKDIKKSWQKIEINFYPVLQYQNSKEKTIDVLYAASSAINKYLEHNKDKNFIVNNEITEFKF